MVAALDSSIFLKSFGLFFCYLYGKNGRSIKIDLNEEFFCLKIIILVYLQSI